MYPVGMFHTDRLFLFIQCPYLKYLFFILKEYFFFKEKKEINKESALGKLSGLYSCGEMGLDWPVGRGGASTEPGCPHGWGQGRQIVGTVRTKWVLPGGLVRLSHWHPCFCLTPGDSLSL